MVDFKLTGKRGEILGVLASSQDCVLFSTLGCLMFFAVLASFNGSIEGQQQEVKVQS